LNSQVARAAKKKMKKLLQRGRGAERQREFAHETLILIGLLSR
jgi:hypothetical protein